jgi:hypothetical protein
MAPLFYTLPDTKNKESKYAAEKSCCDHVWHDDADGDREKTGPQ